MKTNPSIAALLAAALLLCGLACRPPAASAAVDLSRREFAFDLWDWTVPCRDLAMFRVWAEDLKKAGCTRLEISAPWNLLEPAPGHYDFSFIADRLAIAKSLGLGLRVRINSYYASAAPAWLQCDRWRDENGQEPFGIPSINDERFWKHFAPMCSAMARRFHGEDLLFNPFIGVHAELKWADWWTYDNSSLELWKRSIQTPRPQWLWRVVGDAPLPCRPKIPGLTHGIPDAAPENLAFIAFREECWREGVRRFVSAIHSGDAKARVSVPLGESYRRESASMSNLDYFGLSRGAEQVVHSYDFFWHARQDPWYAGAAVAAFRGITGLPVSFEFDGPALFDLGYKQIDLLQIGEKAFAAGAGLKFANYSYSERLPSSWPIVVELGKQMQAATPAAVPARQTVLLFVSKWANYGYREPTEWLHDAQFGAWRMLREHGVPVRFICEDNLGENLRQYRAIYVAFSPPELVPQEDRNRLEKLVNTLPSIVEAPAIPPLKESNEPFLASAPMGEFPVSAAGLPVAPHPMSLKPGWQSNASWKGQPLLVFKKQHVVLGFPLAYIWLHGSDRAASDPVCVWSLRQIGLL